MKKKAKFIILVVTALLIMGSCLTSFGQVVEQQKEGRDISAKLSGTAFVTTDLEGTVQFYTQFLNFKEVKRITIDSEAGLAPFGLSGEHRLAYVAMVPSEWSREHPNFPGLNFVEILDAAPNSFTQDYDRTPIAGEIVMAYSVKGLVKIEKSMRKMSVPIITPLGKSATGKSQTLTVLDPNGIRIQMYEYLR